MAIKILSSENITGTITAIGTYTTGNSVKIFEAQRSGGAVKSDWSYDDATTDMSLGTNTNHAFNLKTNNTNRISINNAGNVGIGISPTEKLEVDGNIQGLDTVMLKNSSSGVKWQFYRDGNETLNFRYNNGSSWSANAISIKNNNNVGIGTYEPDAKVHIFKGSNGATTVGTASDELILENDTDCGLTIRSAADATGVVSFASPTDHNVGQLYYNHDDDSMVIRTNDAIRTIIGSSGIMYIMGATASTNNSLQLQYNSTAGTAEIYSKSTGGNTTFEFYTSSSGTTTQKFNIGSSGDVKITTNGKFLQGVRNTSGTVIDMIGFGSGTDRLQIKGGTSGGAESIAFFDTAGQMATFYNSNFGIGVTNPSQKLEVTGNFKLNGTLVQEGTGNNLTFKYRTANSSTYTGGNATVKFGRFYWTPGHWVTGAPVIKVTLHCKYYQGERREYIIKVGYQDTDPIINELQPSSTAQRICLLVGATTSAGYNYAGQPVYYVDLQWVQTSYIWGWAQIESQVGFLTSNPTSGWGGVVVDSGITQTNGGLIGNYNSFFAGKVGIGTTSPSEKLTLQLNTQNQAFSGKNGNDYLWFLRNEAGAGARQSGRFQLMDTDVTTVNIESASNRNTYFNAGNVGIGTNSPSVPLQVHGQQKWYTTNVDGNELRGFFNPGGSGDDAELSVYKADGATEGVVWRGTGNSYVRIDSTSLKFINFYYGPSNVGQIVTGGSNVLYQSNSDYRLKENVVEMTGALDRVSELKPSRYNFISHPEEQIDGFMAHELQEVVPQAVSGQKDEMNEDGTPKYQGVDHSQIVPLLVGAIKELKAEIELLKNK